MGFSFGEANYPNLNQESYPRYQDFAALLFFALFFPLARLLLDSLIFEKLGKIIIFGKGSIKLKTSIERKKIKKFKECAWKSVYSISAELLALYVILDEPWFSNTSYYWTGPGDQIWPHQKMKLKMKFLYMFCGGFYVYAIFSLAFQETRRSDFMALMAHHIATVGLIVLSYIYRFGRVGSVILALHEGSDMFLETAKICKYSGYDKLASILLSLFALSWFMLRIIYYPFWVLYSTSYEILGILDRQNGRDYLVLYCVFNLLLFGLLALHLYWGRLLVLMLIRQIQAKGQLGNDVRSDSEEEEEHEN